MSVAAGNAGSLIRCPCCHGSTRQPGNHDAPCGYCKGVGKIPNLQLSRHLWLGEMLHSATAADKHIPNVPTPEHLDHMKRLGVELVDPVADMFGGWRVSSGYRSIALNLAVRGRPTGAHPQGFAVDGHALNGASECDVIERVADSGLKFDQVIYEHIGEEGPWVHLGLIRPLTGEQRGLVLMTFDGHDYESFNRNDPRVQH